MKSSWKTTVGGVGGIFSGVAAILAAVANSPGDSLDWSVLAPAITAGFSGIATGIGLLFARDNNVTSDQAIGPRVAPETEAAAADAFRR